jgi:hypothetical protein
MSSNIAIEKTELDALLSSCVTILPEGFAVDLSLNPGLWNWFVRNVGGRSFCDAVAEWLCSAFRKQYGVSFLFSESCVSYEFRYHLYAYLWAKGLQRLRPLSTVLFSRDRLIRSCHSVEIDINDTYRWLQRIVFRYFFGVRKEYRRTAHDPYAAFIFGRTRRIPFLCK